MMMRAARAVVALTALAAASAQSLQSYNINASQVTVGGLSAGAFAAVQFHMAYSSEVKGAAVYAGGPFLCAGDSESTALTTCMDALPTSPDPTSLATAVRDAASSDQIDGVGNLTSARVFFYSGMGDTVVNKKVVQAAVSVYQQFTDKGKVVADFTVDSEHCIPTLNFGEACTSLGSPYIGDCNYDGAGKGLETLYDDLKPRGSAVSSNLMAFDQTQYGASAAISMGSKGYVYVPSACQSGSACALHISMHGCQQTLADINTDYVEHAGFNEWAESNNIVVLYPQVVKSEFEPSNPEGCFDWWGYTDSNYAYRAGKQNMAVHSMMYALMGKK